MREVDVHPCFSCTLPDCDDSDRRCGLRQAGNAARRAYKDGGRPDPVTRLQANIAHRELHSFTRNARRRVQREGGAA